MTSNTESLDNLIRALANLEDISPDRTQESGQVEQIHDPPIVEIYDGMPVPVF